MKTQIWKSKGMFGCCFQELFSVLKKQKTLKTCLIDEAIFVFLVLHVLKMALFREQKKVVFLFFLLFREQKKRHKRIVVLCVFLLPVLTFPLL